MIWHVYKPHIYTPDCGVKVAEYIQERARLGRSSRLPLTQSLASREMLANR